MTRFNGCSPKVITFLCSLLLGVLAGKDALAQTADVGTANEATSTAPIISEVGKELIALLADLAAGEQNPSQRLSLAPVLSKALVTIQKLPQLRLSQQNLALVQAQRTEALAALLPQVTVSAGSGARAGAISGTTYSGTGTQTSISGKQLLYDFGASTGSLRAADKRLSAVEYRIQFQRSEILLKALEAFYETQRALMQVRLSRENLQARRSFVKYIRDREELGASSAADVVRAESRVAEALEQVATAMQKMASAQAVYRQFYAEEAEPYILPDEPVLENFDVLRVSEILKDHPQLTEAEINLQAAQEDRDSAKAKMYGGFYLEATKSETLDPGRPVLQSDSLMIVLRSDIYAGGGQLAKVEQADARVAQAKLERDRIRLDLERTLREAYAEYSGQVAAVSARLLVFRASEQSYAISKDLYAFSRSSLFEVFKSQEELYLVGQRLIDSLVDRAKSKYRLLHASHQLTKYTAEYNCPDPIKCIIDSPSQNSAR